LGITKNLQTVKLNVALAKLVATNIKALLQKYKNIFARNYTDLKGIPPQIVQHHIEFNTTIPPTHQAKYQMNPNYATMVKQYLDKLLSVGFIVLVKEASWLLPIVIVSKNNNKLRICVDFQQLNATTKKDPYPLSFTKEVLDEVASHEVYSFLDGFFGYHHIMIASENRYKIAFITNWGAFVWVIMPFGLLNVSPTYQ
jgi:hypothetical protein